MSSDARWSGPLTRGRAHCAMPRSGTWPCPAARYLPWANRQTPGVRIMGSDDVISSGQFKASCPQCGADLTIKHASVNLKGDDRLICAVHGDVGSLEKVRQAVLEKNRDDIMNCSKKAAVDRLRE